MLNKKREQVGLLIYASIFWFICGMVDYVITVSAYYYFKYFSQLEFSPVVNFLFDYGIPPFYMWLIPLIIILFLIYVHDNVVMIDEIGDYIYKYGAIIESVMIFYFGIIHLNGAFTWFGWNNIIPIWF